LRSPGGRIDRSWWLVSAPKVSDLLREPEALLTTSHLAQLGPPRRAIDAERG
jgi:hypothetical protein